MRGRTVFNLGAIEGATYSDFIFEDIQITDSITALFGFNVQSVKGNHPAGKISRFQFKNIKVTGTHQGTWYNIPTYSTDAWSSKVDVPVASGAPAFSYFFADSDGSFIQDFSFEDIYINGQCMNSLASFPNGGARAFGPVSGFKFKCNN